DGQRVAVLLLGERDRLHQVLVAGLWSKDVAEFRIHEQTASAHATGRKFRELVDERRRVSSPLDQAAIRLPADSQTFSNGVFLRLGVEVTESEAGDGFDLRQGLLEAFLDGGDV